jgi:class 3 adenylate cyclase
VTPGEPRTFVFSDLVGFTALAAERGDGHAAAVALAFHARVRELVARHGGDEVKSLGDGVMLACEDPAAAIRLGLDLAGADEPLVRVGIHTGPAVEADGDYYGTAVNIAARLCSAAGGGEVLVSEETVAAAEDLGALDVGRRRLHWLKNLREPVAAHLVAAPPRPSLRERLRAVGCPDLLREVPT